MTAHYHGTSHLGRCSVDHLLPAVLTDRAKLRLWKFAAENKLAMALKYDNGDMWARAWWALKECMEQIALLDAIDSGAIKPLGG